MTTRKLTVNQVISKTRRKKGEQCERFHFGPPKTDRSRRTIDFPPFVATLLTEQRRDLAQDRLFAGDRWQEAWPCIPILERNTA